MERGAVRREASGLQLRGSVSTGRQPQPQGSWGNAMRRALERNGTQGIGASLRRGWQTAANDNKKPRLLAEAGAS